MTTTLLKQPSAKTVNDINAKDFLQAVYTIVSSKAEEAVFHLTDSMKSELDAHKEKHKTGTSKPYAWQDIKKAALKN